MNYGGGPFGHGGHGHGHGYNNYQQPVPSPGANYGAGWTPRSPAYYPQPYSPYSQPQRQPQSQSHPQSQPQSQFNAGYPTEIQQGMDAVTKFVTARIATPCHRCRGPITTNFSVKGWMKRWSDAAQGQAGHANLMCAAECGKCRVLTCLGCGNEPKRVDSPRNVQGHYLAWCCRDGRLFAIWVTLARFDQVELRVMMESEDSVRSSSGRRGKRSKGTGYGSAGWGAMMSPGFHFVGHPKMTGGLEFKVSDTRTDGFVTLILHLVAVMIPTKNNKNLPPELRGMLQLGLAIDKVANLLRNDSLEDVSKREGLYGAVLEFVHKLGNHPELVNLVRAERHYKKQSPGLEAISNGGKNAGLVLGETIPSVGERVRQLAKQSEVVLSTTESGGLSAQGGRALLDLCRQIGSVHAEIATGEKRPAGATSAEDQWTAYHQDHCVVRDDAIFAPGLYRFYNMASQMSYSHPGRMKRMVTELATMATSLPIGIFVKVSESRPDVMKCLIMGPPDSPYGYGLFEFDLFCNERYPHVPPIMTCHTALGLDLNPNLHGDGKVCLSLLGTWPAGDAAAEWQPGKSTILSVLTSIQAMIFCEDPWRNEPGAERSKGHRADQRAMIYCQKVQKLTVIYGMSAWMDDPRLRYGVWADTVQRHFMINRNRILENVDKWSRSNPGLRSHGLLNKLAHSLDMVCSGR